MRHSIKSWLRPNTNDLPFGERWLTHEEKIQREQDAWFTFIGICSIGVTTLVIWYFIYQFLFHH